MSELVLEVAQLRASYGKVQALHDIDLRLERGSIATVIGPNGAGKSTLLNAIMGVLPSTGEGFGIVYAEAMASGTPALGIAMGGVAEALGGDALGFATTIEAFEPTLKTAIEHSALLSSDERTALSARTVDRFGTARFQQSLFAALEHYL